MTSQTYVNVAVQIQFGNETTISSFIDTKWRIAICCLILLIIVVVIGNFFVMVIITCDQKLRRLTTNKFIASLAVSDLLVGIVVMPLSLYEKFYGNKWVLGFGWCQFHLITFIFSTTASIIHLVAISIDRYFAIMFPTEYQRHSITTSVVPYLIMIWGVSFAVSSTLLMEQNLDANDVCWIENSQYLVLSSLLSFFVPGVIVVYLYMKIFIQLHNHRLYMCGKISRQQGQEKTAKRSLPRVIIEEVKSRRGSRLSQSGSNAGSPTGLANSATHRKSERSPSQPEICNKKVISSRWRSPTICAETLDHDRFMASQKRISIVPDPPSVDAASMICELKEEQLANLQPSQSFSVPDKGCHPRLNSQLSTVFDEEFMDCEQQNKAIQDEKDSCAIEKSPKTLQPFKTDHNTLKPTSSLPGIRSRTPNKLVPPQLLLPGLGPLKANSPPPSPMTSSNVLENIKLQVPKRYDASLSHFNIGNYSLNSSRSSFTSGSDETYRRVSMNSYGSSFTDGTDSTFDIDSRRSSAWSTIRTIILAQKLVSGLQSSLSSATETAVTERQPHASWITKKASARDNLRRIATQVTRAIRRKRRESMAIRRESRATRLVAAILIAFLICWIPYFCVSVYRGICAGLGTNTDKQLHIRLFAVTSWLGYAHSCFNPVIYTCLNKNFRRTVRKFFASSRWRRSRKL